MDIDLYEEEQIQSTSRIPDGPSEPTFVFVDDAHPFDIDAYIANYKGRTAIDRLVHIINTCPSIAPAAAAHAARIIPTTRDPNLYGAVQSAYESARLKGTSGDLPPVSEVLKVDQAWVDATSSKNLSERQRLEVELKNYTNNMIKESIRMAHRDLGNFYRAAGDYTTAMRHHTKSREFCTTSQHVLDMNFACLELLIEQGHYAHIGTYVYKAESALDALAVTLAKDKDKDAAAVLIAPAGSAAASKKAPGTAEREKVQSKLEYASGLSRLGQGHYERAAQSFLKVGSVDSLGDWVDVLLAPGDIAIYGTLCSLASYSRGAVNARVLDNSEFGVFIEQEPYVRELLDAYMGSRFKDVLSLLDRFSTRHYLDIHLSTHVKNLTTLIRDKCLVMYLQPFASIRLELMSVAFGWTVEEVEKAVVGLIQSGDIKARVDSLNKVLKAKDVDPRTELFLRATTAGEEMQSATRRLLLRLRLQQADLVVKAPKGNQGGLGNVMDFMMD